MVLWFHWIITNFYGFCCCRVYPQNLACVWLENDQSNSFFRGKNQLFKFYCSYNEKKSPYSFPIGTCGLVDQSHTHCATEIHVLDNKCGQCKLFLSAIKSPYCDILSYKKVEVRGCQASLTFIEVQYKLITYW